MTAESRSYKDDRKYYVSVKPGIPTLLYFRITNLGLTFFKNCVCSFSFDEGFTVLDGSQYYEGLDFKKTLVVQKRNRCAQFLPNMNHLGVAPCNHLVFPVCVETPTKAGEYKVQVLLSSESTWAEAHQWLKIRTEE